MSLIILDGKIWKRDPGDENSLLSASYADIIPEIERLRALSPPEPTEGQIEHVRRLNDSKDPMFRNGWNGACDALYAALRAMPLQDHGWQDIDTAPKDKHILLFGAQIPPFRGVQYYDPLVFSGYWDSIDQAWCSAGSTAEGPFFHATHWMPLPAPAMVAEQGTKS